MATDHADNVLWKEKPPMVPCVTYKLLKKDEKWNNWNLKAIPFRALLKKKHSPCSKLIYHLKKILVQLQLTHYTNLIKKDPQKAFVKETSLSVFYQLSYCIIAEIFL